MIDNLKILLPGPSSMVGQLRRRIFPLNNGVPNCRALLRASPVVLSMGHCKIIFHIQVQLFTLFFRNLATPPIELKLGQQMGGGGY